jgi:hypothetical protein
MHQYNTRTSRARQEVRRSKAHAFPLPGSAALTLCGLKAEQASYQPRLTGEYTPVECERCLKKLRISAETAQTLVKPIPLDWY